MWPLWGVLGVDLLSTEPSKPRLCSLSCTLRSSRASASACNASNCRPVVCRNARASPREPTWALKTYRLQDISTLFLNLIHFSLYVYGIFTRRAPLGDRSSLAAAISLSCSWSPSKWIATRIQSWTTTSLQNIHRNPIDSPDLHRFTTYHSWLKTK